MEKKREKMLTYEEKLDGEVGIKNLEETEQSMVLRKGKNKKIRI